jgi:hypothetical protein
MKRLLPVLILAAALLAPAAASADDASVWAAINSKNDQIKQQNPAWEKGLKRFYRSRLRDWQPFQQANAAQIQTAAELDAAIKAQTPSTAKGARATKLSLLSLDAVRVHFDLMARATQAASQKHYRKAARLVDRSIPYARRSSRYARRYYRAWKALGFKPQG